MADRNEMTDERAWMIGAIVGAVAFVLLWLFFFGFLGALFLGAVIGLVVAIVLLMRGRPVGAVPQTMEPHDRAAPGTETTGLVRKGPGPAKVGEPSIGEAHVPAEARGGSGADMVPEAGGRRDPVVPGGESSSRNAEGDLISGRDVGRTGARGPDLDDDGTSRADGPEADHLEGEGDEPYRTAPPVGGPGRDDGGDGTGTSDDDGGRRTAAAAGFMSGDTISDDAATGTPAPGGRSDALVGDEDGSPMRDDGGDGVDAGEPLRSGPEGSTDGAMGGYGRDGMDDAGDAGRPGGAGTFGDSAAMDPLSGDASSRSGDFGARDGTAGVADATIADPGMAGGADDDGSGLDRRAGAMSGFGDGEDGSLASDAESADPAGAVAPAGEGFDRGRDVGRASYDAEPGAIEPGETVADIVEEEEIPDVPSELEGSRGSDDPAGAAIGDTDGMASATADPMAAGGEIGTRPEGLDGPRGGSADDLKMIKGVGPKLEEMLNGMGIYHFDQVASWGADEVAWCDSNLKGFKGRVTRDDWVAQAGILASGAETEFSKRAERDDIYGEDG